MKKLFGVLAIVFCISLNVMAIDPPEPEVNPRGPETTYVKSGKFSHGNTVRPTYENKLVPGVYVIKVIAYVSESDTPVVLSSGTYHLDTVHEGSAVAAEEITITNVIHGKVK